MARLGCLWFTTGSPWLLEEENEHILLDCVRLPRPRYTSSLVNGFTASLVTSGMQDVAWVRLWTRRGRLGVGGRIWADSGSMRVATGYAADYI